MTATNTDNSLCKAYEALIFVYGSSSGVNLWVVYSGLSCRARRWWRRIGLPMWTAKTTSITPKGGRNPEGR
jgi:hypothetical protein